MICTLPGQRGLTTPRRRVGSPSMPTRRILLCAAACLAALPALAAAQLPTNQRLYDTTTSMPEVRASRLAKRVHAASGGRVASPRRAAKDQGLSGDDAAGRGAFLMDSLRQGL